jgi:hypothetical protein
MIGLFGGSISTIMVIRNACQKRVEGNLANAVAKIKDMEDIKCPQETLKTANIYRIKIENSGKVFGTISVFPSVIFLIWIFLTCLYVILSPDCIKLFEHTDQKYHNSSKTDPNQTAETNNAVDPSALKDLGIAVSSILYKGLFNKFTIGLIAFIDALCIYIAQKNWKLPKSQYQEIIKLHKTVVLDKVPGKYQ